MKKILNAEQTKICDKNCIENGISMMQLVSRAGKAVADFLLKNYPNGKFIFFCGKGNNGEDGKYASILLYQKNIYAKIVDVFQTAMQEEKKVDNQILQSFEELYLEELGKDAVAVDCVFGIGFHGELPQNLERILQFMNKFPNKVSVDIASGLNANNGIASKGAFLPHKTITFCNAKCGHYLAGGKDYSQNLQIVDIDIPVASDFCMQLESSDTKEYFVQNQNTHKNSNGKVCMIAGSEEFFGSALLCESAVTAMRLGCGYTSVCVPVELKSYVLQRILQSTAIFYDGFEEKVFENICQNYDVIVAGMGLKPTETALKIAKYLLKNYEKTLIFDAEILNQISKSDCNLLKDKKCKLVITPHIKEFSRLTKLSMAEILQDPIEIAKDFAQQNNLILLLKGTSGIVTDGNEVYLTTNGTNALAKAGSGDVFAGVLAGLCSICCRTQKDICQDSQKNRLLKAVASADFVFAECGNNISKKMPAVCSLSADILAEIPLVVDSILKN